MTASRITQLVAKLHTSPNAAVIKPPNIGPMNLAPFITVELSAMALVSSCRLGKSLEIRACLAGASKALPKPSTAFPTTMCQASIRPLTTKASMTTDCSMARVLVANKTRRTSKRSRKTPANGVINNMGICKLKADNPSMKVEPERL